MSQVFCVGVRLLNSNSWAIELAETRQTTAPTNEAV